MAIPPRDTDCIVCGTPNATVTGSAHAAQTNCSRCGTFTLSGTVLTTLPDRLETDIIRRSKMSHALRRAQASAGFGALIIKADDLPSYWSMERLPDPLDAARSLVFWLGEHQEVAHRFATPDRGMISAQIGLPIEPQGGDGPALAWLFTMFEEREWFRRGKGNANQLEVQLTPKGWEQYAELSQKREEGRNAFMAMKFGDTDLDWMVEHCFRDAVSRAGFTLKKLTDEQPAGLIDNQIRAALLSARFIVADLSHANLGAYWEAGYAEGLARPVIYTCERSVWAQKQTHFDTSHMLTVIWEKAKADEAGRTLTSAIRATLRSEAKQTD